MKIISSSLYETEMAGFEFAKRLNRNSIVGLYGELGSGKTCFVKGASRAFRVREVVNSPTYSLVNIYKGTRTIFHMDAYRLESVEEMIDIGFEEYISQDGLCFIEWADRIEDIIPKEAVKVVFKIMNDKIREITIQNSNWIMN